MKTIYTLLACIIAIHAWSQVGQHYTQTDKGGYSRAYFKNGKLSTEIFNPTAYSERGYARAYNTKGAIIYEKETSRFAMISSVRFSYYDSGAVKKAEYSSHPDAGIQWYREYTSFDEKGNVTGVIKDDWDKTGILVEPGTYKTSPAPKIQEKPKPVNKDSVNFYREFRNVDPTGSLVHEKKAFTDKGYTLTTWKTVGKLHRDMIEFYKSPGIQSIHKTYYSNGKVETETIYEKNVKHFKKWNEKGELIEEAFNLKI